MSSAVDRGIEDFRLSEVSGLSDFSPLHAPKVSFQDDPFGSQERQQTPLGALAQLI